MRRISGGEKRDMAEKLGSKAPEKGTSNVAGSKFVLKAESFSDWVGRRTVLESKGGPKPVQMPKERSNKVKFKDVKQRVPGGRRDTTMDSRPKRMRTRGDRNRGAIGNQED
jgi:hypothetical protein